MKLPGQGLKLPGSKGEELATGYLRNKGYAILHRNYRTPVGEADIIARDGSIIVFVEVKSRSSDSFGQPFEAVDLRKRDKLRKVALYYLKHRGGELPVRFDVVSITCEAGKAVVSHISDAFEI